MPLWLLMEKRNSIADRDFKGSHSSANMYSSSAVELDRRTMTLNLTPSQPWWFSQSTDGK